MAYTPTPVVADALQKWMDEREGGELYLAEIFAAGWVARGEQEPEEFRHEFDAPDVSTVPVVGSEGAAPPDGGETTGMWKMNEEQS